MAEVIGIYLVSALIATWLVASARKNVRDGLREKRQRVVFGLRIDQSIGFAPPLVEAAAGAGHPIIVVEQPQFAKAALAQGPQDGSSLRSLLAAVSDGEVERRALAGNRVSPELSVVPGDNVLADR